LLIAINLYRYSGNFTSPLRFSVAINVDFATIDLRGVIRR
jgi:hypothetical protein